MASTRTIRADPPGTDFVVPVAESFGGIFVTPRALDFGDVPVGGRARLDVTVTETGSSFLQLGCSSATGPFQLASSGAPDNVQWSLDFSPLSPGLQTGTATFCGSGAVFCSPNRVTATGTGVSADAGR